MFAREKACDFHGPAFNVVSSSLGVTPHRHLLQKNQEKKAAYQMKKGHG
jgi:hypothetical protein